MSCDICGAKGVSLTRLLDGYKTADIQDICHACEKTVNAHLWKVTQLAHTMTSTLMQRFMAALKGKKLP